MYIKTVLRVGVTAMLSALATFAAQADPVTFGEDPTANRTVPAAGNSAQARSAFLGKLSSFDVETFEGATVGSPTSLEIFGKAASLTQDSFPSVPGKISGNTTAGRFNTTPNADGVVGAGQWWESGRQFAITLGAGTHATAFGFFGTDFGDFDGKLEIDLVDLDGSGGTRTIAVSHSIPTGGTRITPANGAYDGSLLFWGYADADFSFEKIAFRVVQADGTPVSQYDIVGFDQLVIGQVGTGGTIPEPTSLALAGLALLGLGATTRRKLRA